MLRDGLRLQPATHGLGVLGETLQGLGGLRVTLHILLHLAERLLDHGIGVLAYRAV